MKNKIKFAIVGCRNIAPFHADAIKDIDNAELTGHAPSFWNEIDGDLKPTARDECPKGPIKKIGSLWDLMGKYPNLYGDFFKEDNF